MSDTTTKKITKSVYSVIVSFEEVYFFLKQKKIEEEEVNLYSSTSGGFVY